LRHRLYQETHQTGEQLGGIEMAFGGAVEGSCGPNFLPGIAVVVVIILLLIAMGIVF
jgi:hypothetical protein